MFLKSLRVKYILKKWFLKLLNNVDKPSLVVNIIEESIHSKRNTVLECLQHNKEQNFSNKMVFECILYRVMVVPVELEL